MRVAVLGAYGAVGRRLVAHARSLGHAVTAVGRDSDRLAQVRADEQVALDLHDTEALRALARTQDVVVNTTGVEDPGPARTATAAGAAFMDISADGAHLDRLARIDSPERPIAAGVGLAPGLTNLLAAAVPPGDDPLHIGIVGGVGERHGDAGRRWVWDAAGRPVTSGGAVEYVYRRARRFAVPGLGHRHLLRAGFGEQDQLAADLDRPVSTWLGLDPPWVTALLGVAGFVPGAGVHLDRLSGPVARWLGAYDRWVLVVANTTTPIAWASGHSETDATATVAALCLHALHHATPGVHAAHRLVTLDELRDELAHRGIRVGALSPTRS